jgi:hypothetical protein
VIHGGMSRDNVDECGQNSEPDDGDNSNTTHERDLPARCSKRDLYMFHCASTSLTEPAQHGQTWTEARDNDYAEAYPMCVVTSENEDCEEVQQRVRGQLAGFEQGADTSLCVLPLTSSLQRA